jgi:uncharacterized protein YbaR (Trm112 family)
MVIDRRYKRMMIDAELLKILRCPETHQPLALADAALVERLNQLIASGQLHDRAGNLVKEQLDGGLIRSDQRFLYPIRQNIPVLLTDEVILLA